MIGNRMDESASDCQEIRLEERRHTNVTGEANRHRQKSREWWASKDFEFRYFSQRLRQAAFCVELFHLQLLLFFYV
jgi:hypothetical protein